MQKITPFLWFDGTAEEAMLQMDKIDVRRLQQAYDQEQPHEESAALARG